MMIVVKVKVDTDRCDKRKRYDSSSKRSNSSSRM